MRGGGGAVGAAQRHVAAHSPADPAPPLASQSAAARRPTPARAQAPPAPRSSPSPGSSPSCTFSPSSPPASTATPTPSSAAPPSPTTPRRSCWPWSTSAPRLCPRRRWATRPSCEPPRAASPIVSALELSPLCSIFCSPLLLRAAATVNPTRVCPASGELRMAIQIERTRMRAHGCRRPAPRLPPRPSPPPLRFLLVLHVGRPRPHPTPQAPARLGQLRSWPPAGRPARPPACLRPHRPLPRP